MAANIPDNNYFFQIAMLGDSGVGKSDLTSRFTQNMFNINTFSTTGADITIREVHINENIIKARFWDIGGAERFKGVVGTYCTRATGALIVYDITSRITFENVEWWLKTLRDNAGSNNLVIMLVGNKYDLAHRREVAIEEAKSFSERNNLLFIETSALDATNVKEGFMNVLTQINNNLRRQ